VKRTVACLTTVASLSLVALGLVPAAAPASTPSASLHFTNQAALQEDGTVLVSLIYLCNPSAFGGPAGSVAARLEQGEPPAYGEAFALAECNGKKHTVTLDIAPGPFSPGPATAQAVVFNADFSSEAETRAVLKVK
jgi:hypothetical protein